MNHSTYATGWRKRREISDRNDRDAGNGNKRRIGVGKGNNNNRGKGGIEVALEEIADTPLNNNSYSYDRQRITASRNMNA